MSCIWGKISDKYFTTYGYTQYMLGQAASKEF